MMEKCEKCKYWNWNGTGSYGTCKLLSNGKTTDRLEVILPDGVTIDPLPIETHRDFGCTLFEQKEDEE